MEAARQISSSVRLIESDVELFNAFVIEGGAPCFMKLTGTMPDSFVRDLGGMTPRDIFVYPSWSDALPIAYLSQIDKLKETRVFNFMESETFENWMNRHNIRGELYLLTVNGFQKAAEDLYVGMNMKDVQRSLKDSFSTLAILKPPIVSDSVIIATFNNDFINQNEYLEQVYEVVKYYSCRDRVDGGYYAPLVSFIQGSGTGKTRTMLEMGRRLLPVFYLQCRPLEHYQFHLPFSIKTESDALQLIRGCILYLSNYTPLRSKDEFDWSDFISRFTPSVGSIEAQQKLWEKIFELGTLDNIGNSLELLAHIETVPKFVLVLDEATGLLSKEEQSEESYYIPRKPADFKDDPSAFRLIRRAIRKFPNGLLTVVPLDTNSRFSNFSPTMRFDPSLKQYDGENKPLPLPIVAVDTMDIGLFDLYQKMIGKMEQLIEWKSENTTKIITLGRVLWRPYLDRWLNLLQPSGGPYSSENMTTALNELSDIASIKLGVKMREFADLKKYKEENTLAALLQICPAFLVGRHLVEYYISKNAALIYGFSADRNELYVTFYNEPILSHAAWKFLSLKEPESGSLHFCTALKVLLKYQNYGFTNAGDVGEYASMLLLLLAGRPTVPNVVQLEMIHLGDFLSRLFAHNFTIPVNLSDHFVGFSSFYSLDTFKDGISAELIKICFLRHQAIKLNQGYPAVDLIIPLYSKSSEAIGCIAVQVKNRSSNVATIEGFTSFQEMASLGKEPIDDTKMAQMKGEAKATWPIEYFLKIESAMRKIIGDSAPLLSIVMNVSSSSDVKPFFKANGMRIWAEGLCEEVFSIPFKDSESEHVNNSEGAEIFELLGNLVASDYSNWARFEKTIEDSYKKPSVGEPGNDAFAREDQYQMKKFAKYHEDCFHPYRRIQQPARRLPPKRKNDSVPESKRFASEAPEVDEYEASD